MKINTILYTNREIIHFIYMEFEYINNNISEYVYSKIITAKESTENEDEFIEKLYKTECISEILTAYYRKKLDTMLIKVYVDSTNDVKIPNRNNIAFLVINDDDKKMLNLYKLMYPEYYDMYFK